jgi:hypothetical protein
MNTRSLFLIFLVLVVLSIGTASATTFSYNDGVPQITVSSGTATFTEIYDDLVATKGGSSTDYIEQVGTDTYLIKCSIKTSSNGIFNITSEDGSEFRFGYVHTAGGYSYGGSAGEWHVSDVTWKTWNISTNVPANTGSRRVILPNGSSFDNVTCDYFSKIYFGESTTGISGDNATLNEVRCSNWTGFIEVRGDYFDISNLQMHNADFTSGTDGLKLYGDFGTLNGLNVTNIGNKTDTDSTGTYGLKLLGNHNDISNTYTDNIQYSSYNLGGSYNTFTNITTIDSGHNALECRGSHSTYNDVTITDAKIHSWFSSGDNLENITVTNMSITHSGSGSPIRLLGENTPLSDFHFSNVSYNAGELVWGGVQNSTFVNINGDTTSRMIWQLGKSYDNNYLTENVTFAHSSFIGQDTPYSVNLYSHIKLVNSVYSDTYTSGSVHPWSIRNYFPLNLKVVNTTGVPVEGATVTFSDYNFSALNSDYQETDTVTTGSDGRPSELIYLCDRHRNTTNLFDRYTITATYGGESVSVSSVNPQSSWRSTDLTDLQGELITLTLDVTGEGEPTVEYWTPTTGKHYIGVPETWTWNAITGQFDITFSGTYTEPQTENTGVEVRP